MVEDSASTVQKQLRLPQTTNRPISTNGRDGLRNRPRSKIASTATGKATKPSRWLIVITPGRINAFSHGMVKTNRQNRPKAARLKDEFLTLTNGAESKRIGLAVPRLLSAVDATVI
jgi:hypothetical protein